jgi:hypothetical protein
MAHRAGRHLERPPSFSGHCGHGRACTAYLAVQPRTTSRRNSTTGGSGRVSAYMFLQPPVAACAPKPAGGQVPIGPKERTDGHASRPGRTLDTQPPPPSRCPGRRRWKRGPRSPKARPPATCSRPDAARRMHRRPRHEGGGPAQCRGTRRQISSALRPADFAGSLAAKACVGALRAGSVRTVASVS